MTAVREHFEATRLDTTSPKKAEDLGTWPIVEDAQKALGGDWDHDGHNRWWRREGTILTEIWRTPPRCT